LVPIFQELCGAKLLPALAQRSEQLLEEILQRIDFHSFRFKTGGGETQFTSLNKGFTLEVDPNPKDDGF